MTNTMTNTAHNLTQHNLTTQENTMKTSIKHISLLTLGILISTLTLASSVTIEETFISGSAATAGSVNTKFAGVGNAINDNDGRISTNATNIGNLQTSASAAVVAIQANANDVGVNQASIIATQSTVTANTSAISGLQNSANANAATFTNIDTTLDDYGLRIGNLEANTATSTFSPTGTGTAVANSTADNPLIRVDCNSGESLQAAIETAPIHGKVIITISGVCIDDIFVRRSGITIQGLAGDKTDVIQGNATGFSSAASENYQYTAVNPVGLVQRPPNSTGGMQAAFESRGRRGVFLKDLTINAGNNNHAIRVGDNNRLILNNVTLNGHNYGMRVFNNSVVNLTNTTITTDGAAGIDGSGNATCNNPFCGSGIFASVNSSISLKSGNTLSSAANALNGYALAAINGVGISLRGANNNIESLSIVSSNFEQTRFERGGAGNQIRGDLEVCLGSSFIVQQISINANSGESEIEVCGQSTMLLEPRSSGAISVTTSEIEVEAGSTFIVSEGERTTSFPVSFTGLNSNNIDIDVELQSSFINENGGTIPANFDIGGSSSLLLENSTTISGNVDMYQNSSFYSEANSDISGNLSIDGFSTYFAVEQGNSVAAGSVNQSVSGTVTCKNAEAIETEGDDSGSTNDLCSASE